MIAVYLIVQVNLAVLDEANVKKLKKVSLLVKTALKDGWVQHVMIHVSMVYNSPWIVEYVAVIRVGPARDATRYVWDMERASRINVFVIH